MPGQNSSISVMVVRDEQVAPSQEVDTGSAAEQSAAGEAGANPPQATEGGTPRATELGAP